METPRSIHPQEPRWRRLPEERPKQILDAALEVFGEHGLAVARLEDIAKRAGLSKGTIYLYFPNKEELFREVIRSTVVSNIETSEQEISAMAGTATEVLTRSLRAYWVFIRSPQFAPLFRLIHAEIQNFPDLARFYAEEVVARRLRLIASIVERGVESGEFRPVNAFSAARMVAAPFVIHGLWCSHRECFSSVTIPAASDANMLDELIDFYLHALRSPSDAASSAST